MAILLTGGTGKTSRKLAPLLQSARKDFLLASRSAEKHAPQGMAGVNFDWLDSSTYEKPFQHQFPSGEKIEAIYVIAPGLPDPLPPITKFTDLAVTKYNVKRIVFLAGLDIRQNGPSFGKYWQHLVDIGIDFCILRPNWFIDNFAGPEYGSTIKDGAIYSSCGNGKISFISAADIAEVAFRALVDEKSHNTDHAIVGPEAITFDEVAAKISHVAGRKIVYKQMTQNEMKEIYQQVGMPEHMVNFILWLESQSASGHFNVLNDGFEKVTGHPPKTFDSWAEDTKAVWQ